jgi:hypothetical protein
MKILKSSKSTLPSGREKTFEKIEYEYNDAELLIRKFTQLEKETIINLCQWLKDNNKVVITEDCYDSQSGWEGIDFYIDKANLSCNGYCLRDNDVNLFIKGGQNPQWYYFWNEEYEMAKKWQENNKTCNL